jgi:hypothetical protein
VSERNDVDERKEFSVVQRQAASCSSSGLDSTRALLESRTQSTVTMNAANMNPATAQAFEGMMQQKQASPRSSSHLPPRPSTHLRAPSAQMKDFMSLYSNLVERCFLSCCQDFTSKALSSKEVSPSSLLSQRPTTEPSHVVVTGIVRHELRRQVPQALGAVSSLFPGQSRIQNPDNCLRQKRAGSASASVNRSVSFEPLSTPSGADTPHPASPHHRDQNAEMMVKTLPPSLLSCGTRSRKEL